MKTAARAVIALTAFAFFARPAAAGAEPVYWGPSFVDAIGVNVHLHYKETPYVQRWPEVRDAIAELGVRHVRDGLFDSDWAPYYAHLNELAASGVRLDLITNLGESEQLISSYPQRVAGIEAFEAPNELKLSSPDAVSTLRSFMGVVRDAATAAHVPVIGPSQAQPKGYAVIGDLSSLVDFGNLHDYPGGHNPGTPGWGGLAFGSRFGSIPYNLAATRQVSGTHPIVTTETGYFTDLSIHGGVPAVIEARYTPRLLLEHFRAGVARTYIYELLDEGRGKDAHYGLMTGDLERRPAFYALAATLWEIGGPKGQDAPRYDALPVTVQTDVADVHHVLFERGDGRFVMALWREASSYDIEMNAFLTVAPVQVSIAGPLPEPQILTFGDDGKLRPRELNRAGAALSLSVDDHVTFLEFGASRR